MSLKMETKPGDQNDRVAMNGWVTVLSKAGWQSVVKRSGASRSSLWNALGMLSGEQWDQILSMHVRNEAGEHVPIPEHAIETDFNNRRRGER